MVRQKMVKFLANQILWNKSLVAAITFAPSLTYEQKKKIFPKLYE